MQTLSFPPQGSWGFFRRMVVQSSNLVSTQKINSNHSRLFLRDSFPFFKPSMKPNIPKSTLIFIERILKERVKKSKGKPTSGGKNKNMAIDMIVKKN